MEDKDNKKKDNKKKPFKPVSSLIIVIAGLVIFSIIKSLPFFKSTGELFSPAAHGIQWWIILPATAIVIGCWKWATRK